MALEQIIADLDDLEERVENLNVDQKTNEDILLNVLKRVDETEKDLRKVRSLSVLAIEEGTEDMRWPYDVQYSYAAYGPLQI